jgi:hypothetical protein
MKVVLSFPKGYSSASSMFCSLQTLFFGVKSSLQMWNKIWIDVPFPQKKNQD